MIGDPQTPAGVTYSTDSPKTTEQKIDEIHAMMVKITGIVENVAEQVGPTLESLTKHPMFKMLVR